MLHAKLKRLEKVERIICRLVIAARADNEKKFDRALDDLVDWRMAGYL